MSKFLDQLERTELDRVALEGAEAGIASDRAGKAAAEEERALEAAQSRLEAVAEAGRIARERLVTELELRRAAQARTEREADAALASLESDAPTRAVPLSDEPMIEGEPPRRADSRRVWLMLVAALLAALVAVLAAGISIGRIGAAGAPGERK